MLQNEIEREVLTNCNPVSQKRPREFAEGSADSNIPVRDLGNDRPSATTSESGSSVFRTVTPVADIHPEPGTSDSSHSKKPRLAKQNKNVTKKSAEGVATSAFRTPNPLKKLRSDQVSTPSVPSRVTTRSAVRNDVNYSDPINIIDKENNENDEKDSATGYRNDMSHDDSVVIPNSKGEKTIIGERLVVLEQIESRRNSAEIETNPDKPDSEPILVDDDSVADKENEDGRSENSENESLSDFLKPLDQYVTQNQTSKPVSKKIFREEKRLLSSQK
ncbi:uncharacterized protein LOC119078407 [Bradysia coprophila]|uniref:uncharacterized protein LOC119078407 n=1 Tax=Bradysia coprophila TaxID=38358 RepID=UPI00187DA65E|nr:uncharacterized protein LOC119078407 [Bradysia coprophila]